MKTMGMPEGETVSTMVWAEVVWTGLMMSTSTPCCRKVLICSVWVDWSFLPSMMVTL